MDASILVTLKKLLGLPEDYDVFDMDVMIHANSAFATLSQLGVGPEEPFAIESNSEVWSDFILNDNNLNPVKTYIYLRTRLLFDPPATSFAIEAIKKQIEELEWRLNARADVREEFRTT